MTNLIYQGKLIRQSLKTPDLQYVTWGGALNYQNGSLVTFFHYDIRAG